MVYKKRSQIFIDENNGNFLVIRSIGYYHTSAPKTIKHLTHTYFFFIRISKSRLFRILLAYLLLTTYIQVFVSYNISEKKKNL